MNETKVKNLISNDLASIAFHFHQTYGMPREVFNDFLKGKTSTDVIKLIANCRKEKWWKYD